MPTLLSAVSQSNLPLMIAVGQVAGSQIFFGDKGSFAVAQLSFTPVDAATGRRLAGCDVNALAFSQFRNNTMVC